MQVFSALADPTRRQIVELLSQGERSAGELVRAFSLTQPAVSQHLRTLRDARLVKVRRDAQRRVYSLDPRGLAEIDAWLSRYRAFWTERLDALDHALNTKEDRK